jgi:hypothetical protein
MNNSLGAEALIAGLLQFMLEKLHKTFIFIHEMQK